MIKKFKQAVLYTIYLIVLLCTSLAACWVLGAMAAIVTGGYKSVLSVW